jgi:hypothetical protein
MDNVKRIADLDPSDVTVVERVFGQSLSGSSAGLLILRLAGDVSSDQPSTDDSEVPAWCNVLEGMSEADLADFDAMLQMPVRLAHEAS